MPEADEERQKPADRLKRDQDPIVERGRPDPAKPAELGMTLTGFLGDSDRAGYRRIYFTQSLDYYAEFREEDVLHSVSIAADEQPFVGEEATRLSLRRDATVEYTQTRKARPPDEFDLDVRFTGRPRAFADRHGFTGARATGCESPSCETLCQTWCYHTPTGCDTQCFTLCAPFGPPCPPPDRGRLLPTETDLHTCDRTCPGGFPHCPERIVEHGPSDIEGACR